MRKSTMPRKMDVSSGALNQRARASMLQDRGGGFRRPILSRPNAGRKSEGGGVKLLDITEQPVNAMARKRKRQQELEEAAAEKKKAQEQRAAEKQVSQRMEPSKFTNCIHTVFDYSALPAVVCKVFKMKFSNTFPLVGGAILPKQALARVTAYSKQPY